MNIKRFVARNSQEAMKMVKKDMGPDAVILKTRTINAKQNGQGKRIEVTAAVDYYAPVVTSCGPDSLSHGMIRLEKEIVEIKKALMKADVSALLPPGLLMNNEIQKRYLYFKTFGLNDGVIKQLMIEDNQIPQPAGKESSRQLQESLSKVLSKIYISGIMENGQRRKIYSFIGPTGVGKTTTLAKMAAMTAIQQGKKTALITLDTFRIAAAAQLQVYARIMGLPVEVAISGEDLQKSIDKHSDSDFIFIDTAGRNPNNREQILELKNMFRHLRHGIHSFLVLSATARYENLVNSDNKFGELPFKSYIFTKLDETMDPSTMLNFLISRRKPISYFTTGQQVPEDIEAASRKKLATLILTGMRSRNYNLYDKGDRNGSGYHSQGLDNR